MKGKEAAIALAALAIARAASGQEVIVYDNSSGFANLRTDRGNSEIGDQIILSNPAFNYIQRFEFEYSFSRGNGDGFAMAQIRFYSMDGLMPAREPFAVSPVFALEEGLRRAVWSGNGVGPLGITVPADFVWSVTFGGLDGGTTEAAGLLYYGEPEIGDSADDYWRRWAAWDVWTLHDTQDPIDFSDNFAARLVAVPEPSAITLIGASALLTALWRRRPVQ